MHENATHLRSHPADGGNVVSHFNEVGRVLFQLEVTQPLVDGLRVLTRETVNLLTHSESHTSKEKTDLALQKLFGSQKIFTWSIFDLTVEVTCKLH